MRLPEIVRKSSGWAAVGLGLLLVTSQVAAQNILPSTRFTSEDGNWGESSNWADRVSGDAGAPTADDIAAVLGGGIANIGSDVGEVLALSVRAGTVSLNDGGALSVSGETVVGSGGRLNISGGTLTTDVLKMTGAIHIDGIADDHQHAFGDSWRVALAETVLGNPTSITAGGILGQGLQLQFVPDDDGAQVVVGNEPILVVSRLTGEAEIRNFSGSPLDLKGYTIASEGAKLARGGRPRWDSLEDQDVEGWVEANPTTETVLSEFNLTSFATIEGGTGLGLGTPYRGVGDTPRDEDLTFSYILGDGRVFDGQVHYEGPINDLVLTVNPETGEASIGNESARVFDIAGFSILSADGALKPADLTGLSEGGWITANPKETAITQLNLEGSTEFGQGSSVALGPIFDTTKAQDLEFSYSTSANSVSVGTIIYGEPMDSGPVFLPADFDMSGTVDFPDFIFLSTQFNQSVDPPGTPPDINGNGTVDFADFIELSTTFGQSAPGAAAVPEPSAAFLALMGFLGMLRLRKPKTRNMVVAATAAVCLCAATHSASAEDFDVRFIRIHPDGPNNTITNSLEALGIVNGSVLDVVLNEDISDKIDVLDFAGGPGTFDVDSPYLNGVEDASMDDFLVYVSGVLEIPAGDWTIGCGSDDGCLVHLPGIEFGDTYGENGPTVDGDGTIIYNGTRGHAWTIGEFEADDDITTGFEALFFERAGGDSFEVGILEGFPEGADANAKITDFTSFAFELSDGESGWEVTGAPFLGGSPGDFNGDGVVDDDDAEEIQDNFLEPGGLADGDINGDGFIDFHDLSEFFPIYLAAQPAGAQSVPEPASLFMLLPGFLALLRLRNRKR